MNSRLEILGITYPRQPHGNRVTHFRHKLVGWWQANKRVFAWRQTADIYRTTVTEILLQQTNATSVHRASSRFFDTFPDWASIASASDDDLLEALRTFGLHNRRTAVLKQLAREFLANTRPPATRRELEALPGVGQYIASVLLAVLHNKPEPFIDTNMARVLERYFGPRKLADIRYDPYLQTLARRVVRGTSPLEINWAVLDYAALVCRSQNPLCATCVVRRTCKWARRKG